MAFIASGLLTHPEMVGLNPEYLHELMWGAAPRAALARALINGKLFHFDINDGYRLKHDVDIGVGLVNPLDWLNVLVAVAQPRLQRSVQSRLQAAADHESVWRVRSEFPDGGGSLHHTVGDGGRGAHGPDHQRSYGCAEGGRRVRR